MTRYEKLEREIVEALKMDGVFVAPLPHTGALNDARVLTKPQIYVVINGSKYERPDRLSVISQEENIRAELFFRAKSRGGKLGIFALYEECLQRLLGRKLTDAKTSITFDEFGYVAGIQNNWQYAAVFSFDIIRVQVNRETPVGNIAEVKFNTEIK